MMAWLNSTFIIFEITGPDIEYGRQVYTLVKASQPNKKPETP